MNFGGRCNCIGWWMQGDMMGRCRSNEKVNFSTVRKHPNFFKQQLL